MVKQEERVIILQAQSQLGTMAHRNLTEVQELTQEMRRFRHDFNNHVYTLDGMSRMKNYTELQAYLSHLSKEISSFSDYIVTGHSALDALLSGNASLAKQKEINVIIDASVPEVLPIQDQDLCILMGNLFSNALEANIKVPDAKLRYIDIRMFVENANLVMIIKNATDGTEKKRGERFLTTKADRQEHGFGLVSIDHILNIYGGFCERLHQNNVFTTQIIIPLTTLPRRK
jgi:sensor histidine kinase regulating citrate/malate metabolism